METRKVVKEFYRIARYNFETRKYDTLLDNQEYSGDLYWTAFKTAGETKKSVSIQRITVVEVLKPNPDNVFAMFFEDENPEVITAEYKVEPPHFAADKLGRYNPVNGWVVPEEIKI